MNRLLIAMVALGLMVPGVTLAGDLDGNTYEVKITDPTKDQPDPDTLEFKDGKFFSAGCEEWGFGWAEYEVTKTDDGMSFKVMTSSEKEGSAVWTGNVMGDEIKGQMVWTKEGQDDITYPFEGMIKK